MTDKVRDVQLKDGTDYTGSAQTYFGEFKTIDTDLDELVTYPYLMVNLNS